MSDLFAAANKNRNQPLAAEVRPQRIDDVIGQRHLLGPGKILRKRVDAGRIGTVILYGPPGIGKTSIAKAIGAQMKKEFRLLHPAHNNVKDIKEVADEARMKDILLFVDEVHRFNAAQQDYLLSLTEEGVFDFLAATTSNPYHALTKALVSRALILKLEPLSIEEMEQVAERALTHLAGKGRMIDIGPEALRLLATRSGGDARRAINAVEGLALGAQPGQVHVVGVEMVEEIFQASPIAYDRNGDAHYDITSAFIKSMRGSDPDATLYWLAHLIHAGEPPEYIARRIMIHACEDVGLADPSALQTAVAALTAVEKIGYPEAQIVLAQAALHIARAPKSASVYRGIALAMGHVQANGAGQVPPHLRDTHYKGAAALGHVGYAYPHDDPRGWVDQTYAAGVAPGQFYQSDARDNPTYEKRADAYWEQVTGYGQVRRFPGAE